MLKHLVNHNLLLVISSRAGSELAEQAASITTVVDKMLYRLPPLTAASLIFWSRGYDG